MSGFPKGWASGVAFGLLLGTVVVAVAEDITLTTYYPSPRGVYQTLRSTGQTTLAETGGNVGIGTGTAIPGSRLEVRGQITAQDTDADFVQLWPDGAIISGFGGTQPLRIGFATNQLAAGWAEMMRVTETGDVGIGTVLPAAKLDVVGTTYTDRLMAGDAQGTSADQGFYNIGANTIGVNTSLYSYGRICAGNSSGNCTGTGGVVIDPGGANLLSIDFPNTTYAISLFRGGEGMASMFKNSGGPLVFESLPAAGTNNEFLFLGSWVNAVTGFRVPSDARFKQDLRPLTSVLDKLDSLTPISYTPSAVAVKRGQPPKERQLGLVGQELEHVFPELVGRVEGDYRTVDYSRLSVVLLEAVKELKARVEALEASEGQGKGD